MRNQFEVTPGAQRPWLLQLFLGVSAALMMASLHALIFNQGRSSSVGMDWRKWWVDTAGYTVVWWSMLLVHARRALVAIRIEGRQVQVHRTIECAPLIGRFFGPRSFGTDEWRTKVESGRFVVFKATPDPEFRESERVEFLCPDSCRAALLEWFKSAEARQDDLVQLG